jgi:aryl-alcohol dehydrogenase-like predicted oxidoreductase
VEKEYAPVYSLVGLGTTVWSPLAAGVLTGKYNSGDVKTRTGFDATWFSEMRLKPENLEKVGQLMPLASDLGCTMAQLALAWCLKNPNVSTAITGATKPAQITENLKALDVLPKLTGEVMAKIEAIVS